MKTGKKFLFFVALVFTSIQLYSAVQITDVKATPISPWAVQIDYRVEGGNLWCPYLSVSNVVTHQVCTASENSIEGEFKLTKGKHSIRWNMMRGNIKWDNCNAVLAIHGYLRYCVIDLSAGKNAATYPVTYLSDIPSGGWKAEHKTTKLVLRLIEPGSFKMNGSYDVTLTKHYYISVFEVTQKQYQLVTGNNPSKFEGDMLPVEKVSWNMIRGDSDTHNWPTKKTVDPNSFVGRLRSRTGLKFDLPTEAQWEYACRAGTTNTYSYGNSENGKYMWYRGNASSTTHDVGAKLPNAWELYDMHGNVLEWCLDWYRNLSSGTDPEGMTSGWDRVMRGGGWYGLANSCTSSYRDDKYAPSDNSDGRGFRLACSAGQ